ncbi:MAG: hypothetical protein WC856_13610 [Methylococcaceae bacterium]|jgi:hypothetical protein
MKALKQRPQKSRYDKRLILLFYYWRLRAESNRRRWLCRASDFIKDQMVIKLTIQKTTNFKINKNLY